MQGYIHHIRRARNFIYIENQYFLGSCYMWPEAQDVGCHHAVCAELVQKIVQKIRAGERFAAYIVQPMFPEGDPYAGALGPPRVCQRRTCTAARLWHLRDLMSTCMHATLIISPARVGTLCEERSQRHDK